MKFIQYIFIPIMGIFFFNACEEPYTPSIVDKEPRYVVESFVEAGAEQKIRPPYVILTHSLPFYEELDRDLIDSRFIHGADVKMVNENDTITLQEYCLSDLPPQLRDRIIREVGIETFDSIEVEYCMYIDIENILQPEEGDHLALNINIDGEIITAETTIPNAVPINDFKFEKPPNQDLAGYKELIGYITDPASVANYYRYKVSINGSRYYAGSFSVVDDGIFNGKTFDFPLTNPQSFSEEVDIDTIGLYKEGNTLSIKWMSMDETHFDFWNSFEFSTNNQGPFSSYTRVNSNVDGALGVFGGYSVLFYDLTVPED